MKNNVGIYLRVSSDKQFFKGHSLEWQEYLLLEYAKTHNLNVVNIYKEKGISGESIEKRPQLLRLLKDVKSKKINHILVYKVDRLGRTALTNSIICKTLIDNDCLLTTSDTGLLELKTAFGSLLYNILSAISQFEVNLLSERVINGKKQRVRNGLYINSYNVYGYDNYCNYDGKRLLKVNEFEKNIIIGIYNDYLNGISMNNIAKELNIKNIPCKRKGHWCQSTIYQILTNKLYIGIVCYNGKAKVDCFENKGVHTPIIEEDVFNKVQELILFRKRRPKKLLNEYSYFANVLVSKEKKSTFKPKQTKSQEKESIRYYCKNKDINFPSIKHIELEKIFARKLKGIKLNYNDKIIKEVFKNDDMEIILNLIKKIDNEQNCLFDCYNNDIIKDSELKERLKQLNFKKDNLLKQLEELKLKCIDYNDTTKNKVYDLLNNNLMINFSSLSANDKMNFVNLFVEKIVIDKEHNIRIKWKRQ